MNIKQKQILYHKLMLGSKIIAIICFITITCTYFFGTVKTNNKIDVLITELGNLTLTDYDVTY